MATCLFCNKEMLEGRLEAIGTYSGDMKWLSYEKFERKGILGSLRIKKRKRIVVKPTNHSNSHYCADCNTIFAQLPV